MSKAKKISYKKKSFYTQEQVDEIKSTYTGWDVANMIGLDVYSKHRSYIYCFAHPTILGKSDNSLGNCYLTDYGMYCYACGRGFDVIDMVMMYYHISFYEAVSFFMNDGKIPTETTSPKDIFPFTNKELEILGIGNKRIPTPKSVSLKKDTSQNTIKSYSYDDDEDKTFYIHVEYVSYLREFYSEDKAFTLHLIHEVARQTRFAKMVWLKYTERHRSDSMWGIMYYHEQKEWAEFEDVYNKLVKLEKELA